MTSITIPKANSVHLLVLVHGMWGHPGHLAEMARIARETHEAHSSDTKYVKDELHILLAEANREEGTYDGVDWCAERVVDEILTEINLIQTEQLRRITKFSITGYSLGGLVSRYVVGIMAQRGYFISNDNEDDKITNAEIRMRPMNFNTIATPHLGLIRYSTLFSTLAHRLGPKLLSRTGEQFYLQDKNSLDGRPLLDIMSDPSLPFFHALTMFRQLRIFANAVNDLTVPYVTAAIEDEDPFVDWEESRLKVEYHPKYRPVITSYTTVSSSNSNTPKHKRRPKPSKPIIPLPPFLIKPFPFNILIYTLLPLLVPVAFVFVFVRFTRATGRSRRRITRLEEKFAEGKSLLQTLGDIERHMERRIEDAVVDAIDNPVGNGVGSTNADTSGMSTPSDGGNSAYISSPSPSPEESEVKYKPSSTSTSASQILTSTLISTFRSHSPSPLLPEPKTSSNLNQKTSKNAPLLTPLQRTICARLNTLLKLKKEIVFIDEFVDGGDQYTVDSSSNVSPPGNPNQTKPSKIAKPTKTISIRNSHAPIVSRDVRNFEHHRIGEGVLRCWAEGLAM